MRRFTLGDKVSGNSQALNLKDCTECGLVYRCLKDNPKITNKEITLITKLPIWSVVRFRPIVEKELGLPKYCENTSNIKPKLSCEKNSILPLLQSQGKHFIIYKKSCPVTISSEYTAKISKISSKGLGVAFINDFPCEIPGTHVDELVKIKKEKINDSHALAKLVQIIQKNKEINVNEQVQELIPQPQKNNNTAEKRCLDCNFLISERNDLYDGLCIHCYYKKIESDIAKGERRSGIFGSDRAGTY